MDAKAFCLENGFYPDGTVPEEDVSEVTHFLEELQKFDKEMGIQ